MRSLKWNDKVILETHPTSGMYKRGAGTTWEDGLSVPATVVSLCTEIYRGFIIVTYRTR